jgi:hypothetical protein
MELRRFFSTSVCEKMSGEELGPGNEPCEGWNRGLRTAGAMTKVPRRGQKFDADGRGSDVVIVARSENGLVPGRIVDAILQLRGVPLGAVEWGGRPGAHLSKTEPGISQVR